MTCLCKALEDVTTRLIIHLLWTVENVDHHPDRLAKVLCCFSLARASGPRWCSTHDQVEGLSESDVTPAHLRLSELGQHLPVCEGGDDETWGAAQVLVPVSELGVADVGKTVFLNIVPPGNARISFNENISHLCLSCDCQLKDWEESILWLIILLTFDGRSIFEQQHLLFSRAYYVTRVHIDCTDCHHLQSNFNNRFVKENQF